MLALSTPACHPRAIARVDALSSADCRGWHQQAYRPRVAHSLRSSQAASSSADNAYGRTQCRPAAGIGVHTWVTRIGARSPSDMLIRHAALASPCQHRRSSLVHPHLERSQHAEPLSPQKRPVVPQRPANASSPTGIASPRWSVQRLTRRVTAIMGFFPNATVDTQWKRSTNLNRQGASPERNQRPRQLERPTKTGSTLPQPAPSLSTSFLSL